MRDFVVCFVRRSVIRTVIRFVMMLMIVLGGQMPVYGAGPPDETLVLQEGEGELVDTGMRESFLIENRLENDRQILSAASQCLREGEAAGEFWVTGRNYSPEGSILKVFYGDSLEYSSTVEVVWEEDGTRCERVRFAVRWTDWKENENGSTEDGSMDTSQTGQQSKMYWRLGDTLTREIDGEMYTFHCIDQNYQNRSGAGQTAALFLCDSVIPADTGAYYAYEKQEDGSYDYVYHPGPICDFGDTESYKFSRVRQWLDEVSKGSDLVWVDIGVTNSYTGQTEEAAFEQLTAADLRPKSLGYQKLTGQLFVLSVEEALKYRQYLWRFGAGLNEAENPETQIGSFSKGYWLRSPYGGTSLEAEGIPAVYMVDLVRGVIRPQQVTVRENSGESDIAEGQRYESREDMAWGMSIGVRPAFALPQQG